jgi:hypothetical protein
MIWNLIFHNFGIKLLKLKVSSGGNIEVNISKLTILCLSMPDSDTNMGRSFSSQWTKYKRYSIEQNPIRFQKY